MSSTALPLSNKERVAGALQRVIDLRARLESDAALVRRWRAVKDFQCDRLRRTYPDLFAQPRYAQAGEFFLTHLYGARDFTLRDSQALRVVPKLTRMLPDRAIETLALAVELDELSETLDERVAEHATLPVDDAVYAKAYRAAGTWDERTRQITVVDQIGRSLEKLARVPLLAGMLHMMRGPAEAMGYGHLQHFLQSGFDAFRAMGSASDFLGVVRERETRLMRRLLDGVPDPFAEISPPGGRRAKARV